MIILGEKLNSSIPSALEMFQNKNDEAIIALCKKQEAAGANYLDINAALLQEDELDTMLHILELVQSNTKCGIMLDSANPDVISEAITKVRNRNVIINSITLDERHSLIDIAARNGAGIVALPISEYGIPDEPIERFQNAETLIELLMSKGISAEKIFIDVIIETLAVNSNAAMCAIKTTALLREKYPKVHLTCGLSNISFGLPKRININLAAIPALICAGLDSAILDITNEKIRSMIFAAEAIAGRDEYCMNYIEENRN